MKTIHSFDAEGYYTGSSEMPPFASSVNSLVATLEPLPEFSPETEIARLVVDRWTIEAIASEEPDLPVDPMPEPEPVKATRCTRRQGRLALLQIGKLDDVESVISSITEPIKKRMAEIEYEADTWDFENILIHELWEAVGGTNEELTELFQLAVTL